MSRESETNGRIPGSKSHLPLSPGLYLIATPIGNARDITLRALDVLAGADVLYAEDTRVTAKLLALHGLSRPLKSYREHNAARIEQHILAELANGKVVGMVSDAGMPLISDPGARLVEAAIDAGHPVTTVPGPSAVTTAIALSGLPSAQFSFVGFLSAKPNERRREISKFGHVPTTLVFFESPNRLAATLADLASLLGNRQAAVARELTKLHEEVRRAPLADLAAHYAHAGAPKGEVVVVVGPPDEAEPAHDNAALDRRILEELTRHPVKEAAAIVAGQLGLPRRTVYARALELKSERSD
ncbi:MAG: 16S rRNA (cytidine(1402)-2'-O)-methyltransferase [Alphaproteobacteria bacterium]|nr:16S rRNA (cytidine(1402)-2'-O)-methyltransferase [Alphaproteobacteria bacterium]